MFEFLKYGQSARRCFLTCGAGGGDFSAVTGGSLRHTLRLIHFFVPMYMCFRPIY